jgi:nucleoside-diphosphate-sugar epimerase
MAHLVIGCGYLGEPAALEWSGQKRRETYATTRSAARAEEMAQLGLKSLLCDVLRPESLRCLPAAETVLYAVGLDRSTGQSMRDVYVDGLRNVLDALPPPGRFIYVSSTSVYGARDGSWVDEEAEVAPLDESGKVVLEAETLLGSRLPTAVILRFAGIYGPDRLLRHQAIQAGEPLPGHPQQWLNLIHVFDGVEAIMAAQERGQPGRVYNVADGYPCTRQQFFSEMARLLGAPPPRFVPGPSRPGREPGSRRIRNARLRQELRVGLRYPSYEEGLSATVRWMREDGDSSLAGPAQQA